MQPLEQRSPERAIAGLFRDNLELELPAGRRERLVRDLAAQGLLRLSHCDYVLCKGPRDADRFSMRHRECDGRVYIESGVAPVVENCDSCARPIWLHGKRKHSVLRSSVNHAGVRAFIDRTLTRHGFRLMPLEEDAYQIWLARQPRAATLRLWWDGLGAAGSCDCAILIDDRHFGILPLETKKNVITLIDLLRRPEDALSFLAMCEPGGAPRAASKKRTLLQEETPPQPWNQDDGPLLCIIATPRDYRAHRDLKQHLTALQKNMTLNFHRACSEALAHPAKVVLVLISAGAISDASWYTAAQRVHKEGHPCLVPILLSPCLLPPFLADVQTLPREGPISRSESQANAWLAIVEEIAELLRASPKVETGKVRPESDGARQHR